MFEREANIMQTFNKLVRAFLGLFQNYTGVYCFIEVHLCVVSEAQFCKRHLVLYHHLLNDFA